MRKAECVPETTAVVHASVPCRACRARHRCRRPRAARVHRTAGLDPGRSLPSPFWTLTGGAGAGQRPDKRTARGGATGSRGGVDRGRGPRRRWCSGGLQAETWFYASLRVEAKSEHGLVPTVWRLCAQRCDDEDDDELGLDQDAVGIIRC